MSPSLRQEAQSDDPLFNLLWSVIDMLNLSVPLAPKNPGGPLLVLIIGRISTEHQNIENIEASYRYVEQFLRETYEGPLDVKLLGEQASGMLTTRASIREAEELIAEGKVDLVISEDLGRIYRNPRHQYNFVQNAVDMRTRVICLGDNLDTSDENWEVVMGAATLRHGLFIPDTRRRVRRTATHSFHKGGLVQKIRYGYRKLTQEEAATGRFGPKDLRIAKRPECSPDISQIRDQVIGGTPYTAIAEWLESEGVEPGPYVKCARWTDRLVKDLLRDPILSGTRTFRDTIYEPIFRTGHHRRRRNLEPETEYCSELAHMSRQEQEELWKAMDRRAARYGDPSQRQNNRRNVARSRSIWPGQAATCGACGGLMYYAGKSLRCQNSMVGALDPCWNHVQVPAVLTRQRMVDWLMDHVEQSPTYRRLLVEATWNLWTRVHGRRDSLQAATKRKVQALESQAENLAKAIAQGGRLDVLLKELAVVQAARDDACAKQIEQHTQSEDGESPHSMEQLDVQLKAALNKLVSTSFEVADLLRRVLPEFVIWPAQALDSTQVRPRARFRLRLSSLIPDANNGHSELADVHGVLDLFEPPQHVAHLKACVAARREAPQPTLRDIARRLHINYMTVKRALDYARRMDRHGLVEPYRELRAQPEKAARWGRRKIRS